MLRHIVGAINIFDIITLKNAKKVYKPQSKGKQYDYENVERRGFLHFWVLASRFIKL